MGALPFPRVPDSFKSGHEKNAGQKIMDDQYSLAWANIEGWINQRRRTRFMKVVGPHFI